MGFVVGDGYRTNPLSVTPGGVTVIVVESNGRVVEYPNIKKPYAYIKTIQKNNPSIIDAYIKGEKK